MKKPCMTDAEIAAAIVPEDDHTGEMAAAGYPRAETLYLGNIPLHADPLCPPGVLAYISGARPQGWVYERFMESTERAREPAEQSVFGRVAWAMQDAADAKAPRSLSEHFMGRRMTDAEQPCMAISPQEQEAGERRMIAKAWTIAVQVHGGQFDKAGESYLFHLARVAMRMDTKSEQVVAILHDVLEDTDEPAHYERVIQEMFGRTIAECCIALCHRKDATESYDEYLRRLAQNPLATKVKLFDCLDNSRHERLSKLPRAEHDRLRRKYGKAITFLCDHGALMPGEKPDEGFDPYPGGYGR